jgi:hypothetical protein
MMSLATSKVDDKDQENRQLACRSLTSTLKIVSAFRGIHPVLKRTLKIAAHFNERYCPIILEKVPASFNEIKNNFSDWAYQNINTALGSLLPVMPRQSPVNPESILFFYSADLKTNYLAEKTSAMNVRIQEIIERMSPMLDVVHASSAKSVLVKPKALQASFNEVFGMIENIASLAVFCGQPKFANALSVVSENMQATVSAMIKVESFPLGSLSRFSAGLNLVTGFFGMLSGIVSLFSSQPDPMEQISQQLNHLSKQMEHLGRQMEHLGKQLDCVLKNQFQMSEMLLFNAQQLDSIQSQIKRFSEKTGQQLQFIATQNLIEADHNIHLYLTKSSAAVMNQQDLHRWVVTLQTWITSPHHLCSKEMNGALLNWHQPFPAKEAVELLSTLTSWSSSVNMIGFVLKQLQHRGCSIPDAFLSLPPLALFLKTVSTYYHGLSALEAVDSQGCQAISDQLKTRYAHFSKFIRALPVKISFWRGLLDRYWDVYQQVEKIVTQEIPFLQASDQKTIGEQFDDMPNVNFKKNQCVEALYNLEEMRLFLIILTQWAGQYEVAATSLPSMQKILDLKVNQLSDFHHLLCGDFIAGPLGGTPFDVQQRFSTSAHQSIRLKKAIIPVAIPTVSAMHQELLNAFDAGGVIADKIRELGQKPMQNKNASAVVEEEKEQAVSTLSSASFFFSQKSSDKKPSVSFYQY